MTDLTLASALTAAILSALLVSGRLRTIPFEFQTRQRRILGWSLLFVVLLLSIAMPIVIGTTQQVSSVDDLNLPSLFVGHAVLVTFLLAWWALRRPVSLGRFMHWSGASSEDIAGGLTLGLKVWGFTFGAALVIGSLLQAVLGDSMSAAGGEVEMPPISDVMLWMVDLPLYAKLTIVGVAMTVEEMFFRAFLQTRIGLLPSSILFAFAHASYGMPMMLIGVFVVSIIIGRDFARHGQLVRSMLAHGVFDTIQLVFVVPAVIRQLQQLSI